MKAMPSNNLPPSVKPNFLGGHFLQFRRSPIGFLTELSKLGDVSFFKMGSQPSYLVNHPDLARDLLVVSAHKFHKGRALQRAKRLLGEGLLTSEGESHLSQRRMIQPAFHRERIKSYAASMISIAEKMANDWHDGETRDIDKEMMRLTLNIVAKTLFDADVEDESDEIGNAMTTLIGLFDYLLLPFSEILEKLPIPHVRRFDRAKETLDNIIYGFINERRASGEDKGDLLSMLLHAQDEESGAKMSDEQVRDECLTLFLAGHETTANALTFAFYLLSQNPEKEKKFHAELDRLFPNGEIPKPEDYPRLKYTEAVFAETMRLCPPAWVLGRLAIEEHEIQNYKIPKARSSSFRCMFCSAIKGFGLTRKFSTRTLLHENAVKEAGQKFIYFPFGGGVRRCVGEQFAWMEGVLLLATLARQMEIKFNARTKIRIAADDDAAPEIRNEDEN
jgi:cytochrome P450